MRLSLRVIFFHVISCCSFSTHVKKVQKLTFSLTVRLTHLHPLKALLKMTTALHLPVCLFQYNEQLRSIRGRGVPHPPGSSLDGLADSLTWSLPPVGAAWLSTPRPYASNQSVSPALNGTPATPATQAEHASSLSALTALPSPCN